MLKIRCPGCGKDYEIPVAMAGKPLRCPQCRSSLPAVAMETGLHGADTNDLRTAAIAAAIPVAEPAPVGMPLMFLAAPKNIGRFEIRGQLGAGAFGTVYRTWDPKLEREVALKVARPDIVNTPQRIERFQREAKAAGRLQHPNIVPVFEVGSEGAYHFIVSPLVAGQTLNEAIEAGAISFRRAAEIVRDLAHALAYAHAQGIVHRDVKPHNILLDEQSKPFLTDFGMAHRQDADQRLTRMGAILGTPAYMAPEQAAAGGAVQPAWDQYALGAVLYHALTGRPPFSGPPAVVLAQVKTQDPPRLAQIKPSVPPELEAICLKAMRRRPEQRFADCRQLADNLTSWLQKARSRAKQKIMIASVIAGLCLVIFAGWISFQTSLESDPAIGEQPFASLPEPVSPQTSFLRVSPLPNITLKKGERAALEILLDAQGVHESIHVRIDGLPTKVFANSINVDPKQKTAKLTLNVAADAAAIEKIATVHVWAGKLAVSENVRIIVNSADQLQPTVRILPIEEITLRRGETKLVQIKVVRSNWNGPIELEFAGFPEHVKFKPTIPGGKAILGDKSASMEINLECGDEALAGMTLAKVSAVYSSSRAEQGFELKIVPSFSLKPIPNVTVNPGDKRPIPVLIERGGFVGPVTLLVANLPPGVTAEQLIIPSGKNHGAITLCAIPEAGQEARAAELRASGGSFPSLATSNFEVCVAKPILLASMKPSFKWPTFGASISQPVPDPSLRVAAYRNDGGVGFWDLEKEHHRFLPQKALTASVISDDGNLLATADENIQVWNLRTEKVIQVLEDKGPILALAFSRDNKWLASGSRDGTARAWNLSETKPQATVIAKRSYAITSVLFHPKEALVAIGDSGGRISFWDLLSKKERAVRHVNTHIITAACFSPDGSLFAVGGNDGLIRIVDVRNAEHTPFLGRQQKPVSFLAFGRGSDLISASQDLTVTVWRLDEKRAIGYRENSSSILYELSKRDSRSFAGLRSNDGKVVAIIGGSAFVEIPLYREPILLKSSPVVDVRFLTRDVLVAVSLDTITLWHTGTRELTLRVPLSRDALKTLTFSADGKSIGFISGGAITVLQLTEPTSATSSQLDVEEIEQPNSTGPRPVYRWTDDLSIMASGTKERIRIRDMKTGKVIKSFDRGPYSTWPIALSCDGKTLALVENQQILDKDGAPPRVNVTLIEISSGRPVRRFMTAPVAFLAFAPDDTWVLALAGDGSTSYWNVASGKLIDTRPNSAPFFAEYGVKGQKSISGLTKGYSGMTISQDNKIFVFDKGSRVRLLDRQSNTSIVLPRTGYEGDLNRSHTVNPRSFDFLGPKSYTRAHMVIRSVTAISPDNRILAVATKDGVELWDIDALVLRPNIPLKLPE